jgi:hypothetical protein
MKSDSHIEGTQEAVVHIGLAVVARSVHVPLDQEDMALEDTGLDEQGLVVVLDDEEVLAAAEAADRRFHRLLEAQEVHEEIPGCSTGQNHVPPRVGIVGAERATLRSRPC